MIPETVIQDVKQRLDVAEVFGRHLALRKRGSGFVARCPFHDDHSPSFRVYADEARFHCFGCGASGDVFAFLQRLAGKPFPIVVRELAAEVGVSVAAGAEFDRSARERSAVLDACAAAQVRFEAALWSVGGQAARDYLRRRGVSEATARAFHLGLAAGDLVPLAGDAGPAVLAALRLAGLVAEREGRAADRFRDRLVLPLSGADGRVLGFAARTLGAEEPRWITTAENAAFRGSRVLFGLAQASSVVRRSACVLFMPSYFDVLACREAGLENAVGGAPFDERRLALLVRAGARRIRLVAPGGSCGVVDPELAATIFGAGDTSGVVVDVVSIPPMQQGQPQSVEHILRTSGRRALEAAIGGAVPLSEHLMDEALRTSGRETRRNDVETKLEAVSRLARITAQMPHGLSRDILERRIAQRLQLTLRAIRAAARGKKPDAEPRRRRRASARRAR
jgi:DNA primase